MFSWGRKCDWSDAVAIRHICHQQLRIALRWHAPRSRRLAAPSRRKAAATACAIRKVPRHDLSSGIAQTLPGVWAGLVPFRCSTQGPAQFDISHPRATHGIEPLWSVHPLWSVYPPATHTCMRCAPSGGLKSAGPPPLPATCPRPSTTGSEQCSSRISHTASTQLPAPAAAAAAAGGHVRPCPCPWVKGFTPSR